MSTLPIESHAPRVSMNRTETVRKLRAFGWAERTIELLLYPRPPVYSFLAGYGANQLEISVTDEVIQPVRG